MRRSRSLSQSENHRNTRKESIATEEAPIGFPYERLPSELQIVVDDEIVWWRTFIALKSCNRSQRKQLLDGKRTEAWLNGHTDRTHSIHSLSLEERVQRKVNITASYMLYKVLYLRATGHLFDVLSQQRDGSKVEEIELDEADRNEFTEMLPEHLNAIAYRIQVYDWQLVRRTKQGRKKKPLIGRGQCVPFHVREKERPCFFFLQPIRRNATRLSKSAINHYGS
jgi:hypothetical protein